MAYRVVSIFLFAIRSSEKKIVKVYGLVHQPAMMRAGGHLDQPGGWSFKTYVRVQKLRASAELCQGTKQIHLPQVSDHKAVVREYFRKNLIGEFFQQGGETWCLADFAFWQGNGAAASVSDSSIQRKTRFLTILGRGALQK